MAYYAKGANAERELMQLFAEKGFSVARVAGSGSNALPCPDLVAMKGNCRLALEVKSVSGTYLNIEKPQIDEQVHWAKNAGIDYFVVWKVFRKGFFLLKKEQFRENKMHYAIKVDEAMGKGIELDVFFEGI